SPPKAAMSVPTRSSIRSSTFGRSTRGDGGRVGAQARAARAGRIAGASPLRTVRGYAAPEAGVKRDWRAGLEAGTRACEAGRSRMPRYRRLFIVAVVIASGLAWRLGERYRYPRIERVILLGFDGAAPNLIAPLLREGKLPAIRRLTEEGASGPLKSARPTKSAILWNSIATGKTMIKHGIVDWTYVNQQGLSAPYQDRKRRVKTYWEILEERGYRTGTLNWWVSHPPFPVPHGFVVSNAFKARADATTVHPPDLYASLDALRWHYPGDVLPEMERLGLPGGKEQDATGPTPNTRPLPPPYGSST